jgi:hypothetical protein
LVSVATIEGTLCAQDLENLKLWTLQVVSNVKSDLTPQGYKDLYDIADRFKTRFPALFNQTVTKDSFKVGNWQLSGAIKYSACETYVLYGLQEVTNLCREQHPT